MLWVAIKPKFQNSNATTALSCIDAAWQDVQKTYIQKEGDQRCYNGSVIAAGLRLLSPSNEGSAVLLEVALLACPLVVANGQQAGRFVGNH